MIKSSWMCVLNFHSCRWFGGFYLVYFHFFYCVIFFSSWVQHIFPCVSIRWKFLRGADWWGFLLNRRFRQSRGKCRCYLWEVFCKTDQDGSAPWAVRADVPVKPTIKYQQLKYSSKVSEFWNEPMSLFTNDLRLYDEGLGFQSPWDESLTSVQLLMRHESILWILFRCDSF